MWAAEKTASRQEGEKRSRSQTSAADRRQTGVRRWGSGHRLERQRYYRLPVFTNPQGSVHPRWWSGKFSRGIYSKVHCGTPQHRLVDNARNVARESHSALFVRASARFVQIGWRFVPEFCRLVPRGANRWAPQEAGRAEGNVRGKEVILARAYRSCASGITRALRRRSSKNPLFRRPAGPGAGGPRRAGFLFHPSQCSHR